MSKRVRKIVESCLLNDIFTLSHCRHKTEYLFFIANKTFIFAFSNTCIFKYKRCMVLPKNSLTALDLWNIWLLCLSCAVLNIFIPVGGRIDQFFSAPWVSPVGDYTYMNNPYLVSIGHYGLKYVVIFIAVMHLITLIYLKMNKKNPRLQKICMMVLLSMACSVSYIAVLKSFSAHACPWSMVSIHLGHVQWLQDMQTSARCFPGGHASGGFSLIILFFAYRHDYPRLARIGLTIALVLGFMMSWVQMVRGAHFLSHNLWSLWWSWLVAFIIYKAFRRFFLGFKPLAVEHS